ncbi:terpene synthase family protein [Streptomyces sp. NPDC006879]|uniref:terpene synthase family protein n=1 Tax=Streptomyces sp. NPDC006879 TaxID=3364767 RepID=UPI0036B6E502
MTVTVRPSRIGRPLPAFYCPFPADLIHPQAAPLETEAVRWLDSFGIYQDATERAWGLATHSADFSCRIIPRGRPAAVLLFIQWNYWANAVDDWQDSGSTDVRTAAVVEHGARLLRSIEGAGAGLLPQGPMTRSLDDLVARTRALLTPFELRRFAEGTRDWLLGAAWQAANAEHGVLPTLNEFAAMGSLANGTRFSLTWSDVANEVHLPPEVRYAPPLQALTDAAGFIVSADNDLFSYDKDDHLDPWEANLVNVLAHERGCAPAEAVRSAVALRDRVMSLFVALHTQLADGADAQLARHLDALTHYLAGSITWQSRAPRYASPRNRHALPVEGAAFEVCLSSEPSVVEEGPPDLPAVAWWWEQLRR